MAERGPRPNEFFSSVQKELTAANALSVARPLLVLAANKFEVKNPAYRAIMGLAFLTDALDGFLARRNGQSPLGALVDIVSDHTTEVLMYSRLKKEGVVPDWAPSVVATRAIVTDTLRVSHMIANNQVVEKDNGLLKIESSSLSESIVASRISRAVSGASKVAVALAAPSHPRLARNLSIIAVAFCVIRGLPVLFNKENRKLWGVWRKAKKSELNSF